VLANWSSALCVGARGSHARLCSPSALRRGSYPLCVRDLAVLVGVSESAVSHGLRLLRDRRLVKARRQGTEMSYALDHHHLPALFREAEYHADRIRQEISDHAYLT